MALKKYVEKLNEYYERLDQGKAHKFNIGHVEKVRGKILAKQEALLRELAETGKPEKKQRLQHKLEIARAQIERADWLLEAIQTKAEK